MATEPTSEKSGEGVEVTGQEPNAAAKPKAEDLYPQAFDLFMDELRETFGIPRFKAATIEEFREVLSLSQSLPPNPNLLHLAQPDAGTPFSDSEIALFRNASLAGTIPAAVVIRSRTTINQLLKVIELTSAQHRESSDAEPTSSTTTNGANTDTPIQTFVEGLLENSELDAPAAWDILSVCIELASFLMRKNRDYGNSALDPVRILSSADPAEQIRVRMDDKLSRLFRGGGAHAAGEDAVQDFVGYWVLMQVAEKKSKGG